MNLWEILKTSKGLPPPDLETLLFARKISGQAVGGSTLKTLTASGYPCMLEGSAGMPVLDYKIYGNSVQNGTPTPENPIEVLSVGDKTKNLFNKNDATVKGFINVDGGISQISVEWFTTENFIKCSGSISLQAKNGLGSAAYISCYDSNKVFLGSVKQNSSNDITSTIQLIEGTEYIKTCCQENNLDSYQLELGSEATAYEPYGYKIPVVVTGKNLWFHHPSITKFGVTLQYSNGEFIFSGACTKSSNFVIESSLKAGTYTLSTNANRIPVNDANYCVSMYKPNEISVGIYNKNSINGFVTFTVNKDIENVEYRIRIEGGVDYAGFVLKPQLELGSESTPYEPYHEPITTNIYLDEPLKTDDILKYPENVLVHADGTAENITLPSIPTFDDTTVISTDTEIQPSNMEIKFKARK